MLEKIIKNRKKILEGIKNNIKLEYGELPEKDIELIVKRRLICMECPFNSKNAEKDGWYASNRPDEHCTMCLCNISLKTACLSCECGIAEYNEKNNSNMEIKW